LAEIGLDAGLLDEHAPKNSQGSSSQATYQPSEEEQSALKLAEQLYSKAKKARSKYDRNWPKYYRMFRGQQWDTRRPSYRHSEVVNHIFKTIQSTVPIQTDNRPRFEFLPEEPSDLELAEILNEAAEADWTKGNWGLQQLEVIYDANFYGTGLSSLTHDEKKNYGAGGLCYDSTDVLYFFPDPDALDVNKRCGFAVYAEPIDVAKLKREYPDKAQFLKPDLVDLNSGGRGDPGADRFTIPNDNWASVAEGVSDPSGKDKVLKITVWVAPEFLSDDYDEKESVVSDPKTGEQKKIFEQIAKWPKGRKIVIASKVVLENTENPYDDAEIPFQRLLNYVVPHEFWGISEVEQLEGPQKTFNKLLNFALDVLTLMGNPIWVVDNSSGVDTDNLVNKPGLVVEKNAGSEVRREEGVQLQPYVLQLAQNMVEWFDAVSGSQEVSRGVQPTGITAASAISSLQEAAQTRLRQKSRNMDYYLQDLGRQWLSRTFQFRTAPEIFRLTGKDGTQKYFRLHVEDHEFTETVQEQDEMGQMQDVQRPTGEIGKRVVVQPYLENGKFDLAQQKVYETRAKFDVRVVTGSSLPFAKAEKEDRLFKLQQIGAIDNEEVLKGMDYPNWQAVTARMQQAAQAQQQAEAAAKGAPPPPQ
jgi:hypothetical protein